MRLTLRDRHRLCTKSTLPPLCTGPRCPLVRSAACQIRVFCRVVAICRWQDHPVSPPRPAITPFHLLRLFFRSVRQTCRSKPLRHFGALQPQNLHLPHSTVSRTRSYIRSSLRSGHTSASTGSHVNSRQSFGDHARLAKCGDNKIRQYSPVCNKMQIPWSMISHVAL